MSIAKFSKGNVLLSFSSFEDYKDIDSQHKLQSHKIVGNILNRLLRLGFTDFHILGDNSISHDHLDSLEGKNLHVHDIFPLTERQLLVNTFFDEHSNNLGYLESMNLKRNFDEITAKKVLELESKISGALGSELTFSNQIPDEEKIEIILRVMVLNYFRQPINDASLWSCDPMIPVLLNNVGRTLEEIQGLIKNDLDYQWTRTKEILNNSNREKYGVTLQEAISPIDKQTAELTEILTLLHTPSEEPTSVIEFDFDVSKVPAHVVKPTEQEDVTFTSDYTLKEALESLSMYEIKRDILLADQLDTLLKLVEDYYSLTVKNVVRQYDVVVDFYASRSAKPSRLMPYDTLENKILLSVDLKGGNVDCYFKGQSFKLNSFFEKGETISTNALGW